MVDACLLPLSGEGGHPHTAFGSAALLRTLSCPAYGQIALRSTSTDDGICSHPTVVVELVPSVQMASPFEIAVPAWIHRCFRSNRVLVEHVHAPSLPRISKLRVVSHEPGIAPLGTPPVVDINSLIARKSAGRVLASGGSPLLAVCVLGRRKTFRVVSVEVDGGPAGEDAPPLLDVLPARIDADTEAFWLSGEGTSQQSREGGGLALGEGEHRAERWGCSVAGITPQLHELWELAAAVIAPTTATAVGFSAFEMAPRAVLLHGPHGTGKTIAAQAIGAELRREFGTKVIELMVPQLLLDNSDTDADGCGGPLRSAFAAAREQGGTAFVIMDELDALGVTDDGSATAGDKMKIKAVRRLIDELELLASTAARVFVVGLTRMAPGSGGRRGDSGHAITSSGLLPPSLLRVRRFERVVTLHPPTEAERREILSMCLSRLSLRGNTPPATEGEGGGGEGLQTETRQRGGRRWQAEQWAHDVAALTGGYVGADLHKLCQRAGMKAVQRSTSQQPPAFTAVVEWKDMIAAIAQIPPSQLRELDVATASEAKRADSGDAFSWEGFGGYAELKDRLVQLVQWRWTYSTSFKKLNLSPISGLLLHGPSGCGKSLLARVLASQCNANFVNAKSSELISKYVGESEAAIRALFARARGAAPCILFFDEIDAIAINRNSVAADGGSGVYQRILSTFLNEMDGVEGKSEGVLVLGATNRIDAIDAALLRPGRFDNSLLVGPPDEVSRLAILRLHTRRMPLAADVDLAAIAAALGGATGSKLEAVCREAGLRSLRRILGGGGESTAGTAANTVEQSDFTWALSRLA